MDENPPAQQLADLLRPFIPADELPTLDALLKKAQHNDRVCDICYANAQAEGAAEQAARDAANT
jgi:hypothetical protein